MRFTLEIQCDNAAFDDLREEISRILAEASERVLAETTVRTFVVRDGNGNTVGRGSIVDDDPAVDDEPPWGSFPEERGHDDLVGAPHAQAHAEVERRRREGGGA